MADFEVIESFLAIIVILLVVIVGILFKQEINNHGNNTIEGGQR